MIHSIKNLYQTTDLDGYVLTAPLQAYQSWIAKRIKEAYSFQPKETASPPQSKGTPTSQSWLAKKINHVFNSQSRLVKAIKDAPIFLRKLAVHVSNFAFGIIAYPFLGLMAAIGVTINLFQLYQLSYHNMDRRDAVNTFFYKILTLKNNECTDINPISEEIRLPVLENDQFIFKPCLKKNKTFTLNSKTFKFETELQKIINFIDEETKNYRKVYICWKRNRISNSNGNIKFHTTIKKVVKDPTDNEKEIEKIEIINDKVEIIFKSFPGFESV